MNCNLNKNNNCCGYRISDDLLNLGQVGQQGIPGERGEKGDKGDSGLSVTPSYANFINTSQQTVQFTTMQRGFFLSIQLRFPKTLN